MISTSSRQSGLETLVKSALLTQNWANIMKLDSGIEPKASLEVRLIPEISIQVIWLPLMDSDRETVRLFPSRHGAFVPWMRYQDYKEGWDRVNTERHCWV